MWGNILSGGWMEYTILINVNLWPFTMLEREEAKIVGPSTQLIWCPNGAKWEGKNFA
jgi:hypothetical protein